MELQNKPCIFCHSTSQLSRVLQMVLCGALCCDGRACAKYIRVVLCEQGSHSHLDSHDVISDLFWSLCIWRFYCCGLFVFPAPTLNDLNPMRAASDHRARLWKNMARMHQFHRRYFLFAFWKCKNRAGQMCWPGFCPHNLRRGRREPERCALTSTHRAVFTFVHIHTQ